MGEFSGCASLDASGAIVRTFPSPGPLPDAGHDDSQRKPLPLTINPPLGSRFRKGLLWARQGRRPQALGLAAFLVLWLILGIMDWRTETVRGDFALYSLEASRVLWEGGDPYDREQVGRNYKYQPINIVLLRPLTLPPLAVAQSFWSTLNVFLILGAIAMQWAFLREGRLPWWLLLILLILCFRAIHGNLKLGQWNTSVYSLGIIGALLLYRHRMILGSLALGLGASLKFLPIFLLIPILLRGAWKQVLASVGAFVVISAVVPSVLLGPARFAELFQDFNFKAAKVMEDQTGRHGERVGVSLNALVYLYLTPAIREDISPEGGIGWRTHSRQAGRNAATAVSAIFLAGAVAVTWLRRRCEPGRLGYFLTMGLWVSTILLVLPHVRVHYLIYTVTPLLGLLAFWHCWKGRSRVAWFALAMVGLALVCQLLTSQDIVGRAAARNFNLHGGNTLLLLALYAGHVGALLRLDNAAGEGEGAGHPPAAHSSPPEAARGE